jgi:hypothetical protein
MWKVIKILIVLFIMVGCVQFALAQKHIILLDRTSVERHAPVNNGEGPFYTLTYELPSARFSRVLCRRGIVAAGFVGVSRSRFD